MSRPPKYIAELDNLCWWGGPLRQYWRQINRLEREEKAVQRAKHKERDKRRPRCRCDAYKFPHRPGGGLCRHPNPPVVRWQDAQAAETAQRIEKFRAMFGEPTDQQMADLVALTSRTRRPYRDRYTGLRRQLARANGLHPIKDRARIEQLIPQALNLAKQLHQQRPKYKYRNMEITENGIRGNWQTAGPMM